MPLQFYSDDGRAGARAVDLGGPSVYQGCQSLNLSTKATVFKRISLLIGGAKHVDRPGPPPLAPALLDGMSYYRIVCEIITTIYTGYNLLAEVEF